MSFTYTVSQGPSIPPPKNGPCHAVCVEVYYLGTHPRPAYQGQPKSPCGVCAFVWDTERVIPKNVQEEWLRPRTMEGKEVIPAGPCAGMPNSQLKDLAELLQKNGGKPYRKSKKCNLFFTDNAALTSIIEAHLGRRATETEIQEGFDFGLCKGRVVRLVLKTFTPDGGGKPVQYVAEVGMGDEGKQVAYGDPLETSPEWIKSVRAKSEEAMSGALDPQKDSDWTDDDPAPRDADAIRPGTADALEEARALDGPDDLF